MANPTKMIDMETIGYRTAKCLMRKSMGSTFVLLEATFTVPITIKRKPPKPASGFFINLHTIKNIALKLRHASPP